MTTNIRRKLLLAVDGSDQALETVRYVGKTVSPEQADLVLFYVGTGFPEVFWDMNNNPIYRSEKSKVMGWLADHQLMIGEFKEKAFSILTRAGFADDAIQIITQTKKTGVLKDIVQESYKGYSAIVAGRAATGRIRQLLQHSFSYKLAEKIKHIPTVIVGGKPVHRKILIALDTSIEAMRGVSCIGALAGAGDLAFTICHCLVPPAMSRISSSWQNTPKEKQQWRKYNENRFGPTMDEAVRRLCDAGIDIDQITCEFAFVRGSAIQKIVETAVVGNFSTIVVGRREAVSFAQRVFRGRFSEKVINAIDNMAVWVVS